MNRNRSDRLRLGGLRSDGVSRTGGSGFGQRLWAAALRGWWFVYLEGGVAVRQLAPAAKLSKGRQFSKVGANGSLGRDESGV